MSADGQRLPFVDGVLILYDVTNQASISKLPESLGEYFVLCAPGLLCIFSFLVILADHGSNKLEAFARVQLPALVVSCKCDAPQRQINPNSIEQVGTVSGYETMQTSAALPDSQKKCVNVVLGMIIRKNGLSFFAFVLYCCLAAVALCWLAFCLFSFLVSAKLDNDPPAGWGNVCFVSVASTTFLINSFILLPLHVRENYGGSFRLAWPGRCFCPLRSAAILFIRCQHTHLC